MLATNPSPSNIPNPLFFEAEAPPLPDADSGDRTTPGVGPSTALSSLDQFTGGVKVWDATDGKLVHALGYSKDLESVFGTEYGRVGKRRWGISNFKDVVMHGSYPDGKVLLRVESTTLGGSE